MQSVNYLHLPAGLLPPALTMAPFRAVVVIEDTVISEWRDLVTEWLVRSGCLYIMAWGDDCGHWDDKLDWANLAEFEYGDIRDDRAVMTTWHEREPLSEVFWFASHCAYHSDVDLTHVAIVGINPINRRDAMLYAYRVKL